MKKIIMSMMLAGLTLTFTACGGEKEGDEDGDKKEQSAAKSIVPDINVDELKTADQIAEAMEKVVEARIEDERLGEEDPDYEGAYTELTNLYADVQNAATEYSKTIEDPEESLAFLERISAITDKMYE